MRAGGVGVGMPSVSSAERRGNARPGSDAGLLGDALECGSEDPQGSRCRAWLSQLDRCPHGLCDGTERKSKREEPV
jgi:hypothetical protein